MAVAEIENTLGYVDKRRLSSGEVTTISGMPVVASSNDVSPLTSVASLRGRLTTINGTYYTAVRLNGMTKNDMVYAVRLNDEAAGI